MKAAYSIKEFCEQYALSPAKVYVMLAAGEITAKKIGARTLIDHSEADRWFKSLPNYEPNPLSGWGSAARAALAAKRAI